MRVPPETGLDVREGTVRLNGKYVQACWIRRNGSHDSPGRTPTPGCEWGKFRKRGSTEANPRQRSKRNRKTQAQASRDKATQLMMDLERRPDERPSDYRNRLRIELQRRGY